MSSMYENTSIKIEALRAFVMVTGRPVITAVQKKREIIEEELEAWSNYSPKIDIDKMRVLSITKSEIDDSKVLLYFHKNIR